MAESDFKRPELIARDLANTVIGSVGNQLFVALQQYIYVPRYLDPIFARINRDLLHDQNSGSTFFGLVAWNSMTSLFLSMQIEYDLRSNFLGRARRLEALRRNLPTIFVALNTAREIGQTIYDPRPDNHGMDIVMGLAAGAFLWFLNHRYDRPLPAVSPRSPKSVTEG